MARALDKKFLDPGQRDSVEKSGRNPGMLDIILLSLLLFKLLLHFMEKNPVGITSAVGMPLIADEMQVMKMPFDLSPVVEPEQPIFDSMEPKHVQKEIKDKVQVVVGNTMNAGPENENELGQKKEVLKETALPESNEGATKSASLDTTTGAVLAYVVGPAVESLNSSMDRVVKNATEMEEPQVIELSSSDEEAQTKSSPKLNPVPKYEDIPMQMRINCRSDYPSFSPTFAREDFTQDATDDQFLDMQEIVIDSPPSPAHSLSSSSDSEFSEVKLQKCMWMVQAQRSQTRNKETLGQ